MVWEGWGIGRNQAFVLFYFFLHFFPLGREYFIPTFCFVFFFLGRGREGFGFGFGFFLLLGEVLKILYY